MIKINKKMRVEANRLEKKIKEEFRKIPEEVIGIKYSIALDTAIYFGFKVGKLIQRGYFKPMTSELLEGHSRSFVEGYGLAFKY
jgi:hypothetical protein